MTDISKLDEDERRLAELGYKQELSRTWSGFSNFAISFSIISILAGCFTTFGVGWNNGGPAGIAWGWPVIAGLILIIGFCMSELVSAFPTSGGIYWWASKLGGPKAGYYTGWLNLIGLLAIVASVAYGAATFLDITLSDFSSDWGAGYSLNRVFILFVIILLLAGAINIFSSQLLALVNNISVWWHIVGAIAVVAILIFGPKSHLSVDQVFGTWINNTGFGDPDNPTSGIPFFFFVIPLGFILTQYTITGFDASAHVSEETGQSGKASAQGLWRSIAYSAVAGWILLLSFLFAATNEGEITKNGGIVQTIFVTAVSGGWAKLILIITCLGQFFCGMSCVTAGSRMLFAFSRDRAVPGHKYWTRLDKNKNPSHSAFGLGAAALIVTIPAIWSPVAFFAVTSMAVIGLFGSFAIPIYLRWRKGDEFKQGEWNLGKKWKWMAPIAVLEIVFVSIFFIMPTTPAGVWWSKDFNLKAANYTPVGFIVVLGGAMIWWWVSAHKHFKGAVRTID